MYILFVWCTEEVEYQKRLEALLAYVWRHGDVPTVSEIAYS